MRKIRYQRVGPPLITKKDIEQGILEDAIFGIVECDLEVPDSLKKNWKIPTFVQKCQIPSERDIIRDHMFDYAMSIGRTTGVKRSLISSMHTKGRDIYLWWVPARSIF